MYIYKHFEFIFVAFATMVNTYFDKIITTDLPKSHNPVISVHYINFINCFAIFAYYVALYSMLLLSYYAQNYAGIIGSSLIVALYWHFVNKYSGKITDIQVFQRVLKTNYLIEQSINY